MVTDLSQYFSDEDCDLEVDTSDEEDENSFETTRKRGQLLRLPTKPAS